MKKVVAKCAEDELECNVVVMRFHLLLLFNVCVYERRRICKY